MARILLAVATIMLVGVAGSLYFAWQHWQGTRDELASLHARTQEAHQAQQTLLRAIDSTREKLDLQQKELQQRHTLDQQDGLIQEQEIATSQQQPRNQRRELMRTPTNLDERPAPASRRMEGDPYRWLDAEAASLLRSAANHLELAGNREAALKALRRTDLLLERGGEARQQVRQVLAKEIAAVEAFHPADVQRIAREISQLQRAARRLKRKVTVRPAASGQRATAIAPDETLLRQRLRRHLDSARMGALSNNSAHFVTNIEKSRNLIQNLFAADATRDGILSELDRLAAGPLDPDPPRIGATLDAIEGARRGDSSP